MRRHIRITSWSYVLVVFVSACADSVTGPNEHSPLPVPGSTSAQAQIDAALGGRTERGVEDEILRLEAAIPGLGGVFIDAAGEVVVYAPANVDAGSVRIALAQRADRVRLGERVRTAFKTGNGLQVRQGEYPFSSLIAWKDALVRRLIRIDGVLANDADEAINRIRITISRPDVAPVVMEAAAKAQVPPGAVETRVGRIPRLVASLRDYWRPTGGGIQIMDSWGRSCTLGYNVTMGGVNGFLTASHCDPSPVGSGSVGGTIYQPTWSHPALGTVHTNPAFDFSHPACMGYTCTRADVMFATYFQSSDWVQRLARTGAPGINNNRGSNTVSGWTSSITPYDAPAIGETVSKVGRTTGTTQGTLAASCESIEIDGYVVYCAGRVINAAVGQGDSGAPVSVHRAGCGVFGCYYAIPLGILYAGGGWWTQDAEGDIYCYSQCEFWYSQWPQIEQHFGGLSISA